MSKEIYPYKRPSGIWYIRGTYLGVTVDQSAGTRDERIARQKIKLIEKEIYEEVILQKPKDRTFAEAAIGYMESGGERALLAPILSCSVKVGERATETKVFGEWLLKDVDQAAINRVAMALHGSHQQSTINRKVFTPIAAVLNYAAEQPSWKYVAFRIRRPEVPRGRVDWRRPEEIEWWLDHSRHMRGILTAYVGTGARASELVGLDWPNVTPGAQRMSLWDDETKASTSRHVDLQQRVRSALPNRPETNDGPVFRNLKGERWHSYDAINNSLDMISEAEAMRRATPTELADLRAMRSARRSRRATDDEKAAARAAYPAALAKVIARAKVPQIHLHVLRHTWATWAYAVTRDLTFLMGQGGWASEKLALRYIHGGSDDIKAEVLAHGWEMRPAAPAGLARRVDAAG